MTWKCKQCGQCCENNGLIPPILPEELEQDPVPGFVRAVLYRLRNDTIWPISESIPCVFLREDRKCSIHGMKPSVCHEFDGEDCPNPNNLSGEM